MRRWLDAVAIYRDPRVVAIFFMGFSSGLPLALTGATLGIWLKESNVSLTAIGLFALVGIAYNLKFLWAPAMDRASLPWLTRWLGRRRSWALATQAALIASLLALGHSDPAADPALTALLALVVAFCSASQDIVIDAFRIELLEDHEQGVGAAATGGAYGITSNAVLPGWVRTEMAERSAGQEAKDRSISTDQVWTERAASYPPGRVVTPQEVAEMIAFLASEESSGVSGEAIRVALGSLW